MARLKNALSEAAAGGTYDADPMASAILRLTNIPLDQIEPDPNQPRKDIGDISDLVASVAVHGVIEPVLVREIDKNRFMLVAGERRFSAAKQASLKEIPAIVRDDFADDARFEVQLVENLHRKDLNVIETAMAYRVLIDQHGYSQRKLAERIGRSVSGINEILRVLTLPSDVVEGVLTSEHSGNRSLLLEISKLPGEEAQRSAWESAKNGQLTVRSARAKKAPVTVTEEAPRPIRETFKTKSGNVTVELAPESDDKILLKALREALAIVTARGKSNPSLDGESN
ncbi:ParB/RepB/Spo0J family partition protein [bacterium]|nr:MAG: ParB/RepB/Spo0J family partition protein [bacterium]